METIYFGNLLHYRAANDTNDITEQISNKPVFVLKIFFCFRSVQQIKLVLGRT